MELQNGATLMLSATDTDHFTFSLEDEEILIYAPELLILTPRAVRCFRLFQFLVRLFPCGDIVDIEESRRAK